ncbi:MAG: T9SS type A sorting domain-containing protein [Bacteroidales bacterium]|nr:T9SS type A sorting domain-containing protein [Bacteroidales bacterium]
MGNDDARGIIEKEGGYWVIGKAKEPSGMVTCENETGNAWLIEISSEGDLVEEHCINMGASEKGGLFKSLRDDFYAIGMAPDTFSEKAQLNVTKINPDGEVVWTRNFGDKNKAFWHLPNGTTTADGGIIVGIDTQWAGGDISNYYGIDDVWVIKVDSLGNLEWETTLGTNGDEIAGRYTLSRDGGYYVSMCGRPGNNGSITACTPQTTDMYDGLLVKLDGNGQVLWNRCYAGSEDDQIYQALELDDGLLLLCDTQSDDRDAEGAGYHLGYPHGDEFYGKTCDIWLLKTDFDGNILWSKCYGGTGHEFPLKVFQNEDGGFTVFGTTQSLDGDVASTSNMHPHQPEVGQKIWVFRIDADGNMLWERAIGHYGNTPIHLGDVIKHDDVTYTLAATSPGSSTTNTLYNGDLNCSNSEFCGYNNYWVLHITDIFNYDDPTGIEEQPEVVPLQMKVHPNPATTWVAIDYTLPNGNAKAELSIFNAMGIKVKQVELDGNQGQKVLDLRGLAPGVYFYTLCCGGLRQTDKLVLVR